MDEFVHWIAADNIEHQKLREEKKKHSADKLTEQFLAGVPLPPLTLPPLLL